MEVERWFFFISCKMGLHTREQLHRWIQTKTVLCCTLSLPRWAKLLPTQRSSSVNSSKRKIKKLKISMTAIFEVDIMNEFTLGVAGEAFSFGQCYNNVKDCLSFTSYVFQRIRESRYHFSYKRKEYHVGYPYSPLTTLSYPGLEAMSSRL